MSTKVLFLNSPFLPLLSSIHSPHFQKDLMVFDMWFQSKQTNQKKLSGLNSEKSVLVDREGIEDTAMYLVMEGSQVPSGEKGPKGPLPGFLLSLHPSLTPAQPPRA